MKEIEDIFKIIKTAIVCDYLDGREVGCSPYESLQSLCGNQFEEIAVDSYKKGYIRFSTPPEGLTHLTIPQIKDILRANGLKLTGKKDDLVKRVVESLPESAYENDVPQVNVLTDAGKDLVDANYIFIRNKFELDARFCSDVIESALSIGCRFTKEDSIRVFRRMHENQCDEHIKNKDWFSLWREFCTLANLLDTADPGGNFDDAEKYILRSICISLSGMTDCNMLEHRDVVRIDLCALEFLANFRFRHSKKKEEIIRNFIPIAKEMFQILPFSYFYPPAMALILSDAIQRKRNSDFCVYGKKKYAALWRVPDESSTEYECYPVPKILY